MQWGILSACEYTLYSYGLSRLLAVVSVNKNDTIMTCIVGENIRQKVQSLTRVCVCVCVCVCKSQGWGVSTTRSGPSENVQYLTRLRESSYPLNHKLNNCKG